MRHIQTRYLWLQDAVAGKIVSVRKIKGTDNPADDLTKSVPAEAMRLTLARLGQEKV